MNSLRKLTSSRWLAPAVLGAVTLLFFWRYFLLDQALYAGDTAFVFVPFRQFLADHLNIGKIPLWNPYLFGGTPALAESQYQVFYPINLLMMVLGAARGMSWILAFHLFWAGLGSFLFLRQGPNLGRGAALFGAISFAFGACLQSRLSIPVYTNAAAWLPWILWGYDRARLHGGYCLAAAPVFLALQLCTGAAQYSYYTLALLLAYHFFGAAKAPERVAGWKVLLGILILGVALAMAQLVPELELALLSDRGTKASYSFAITGSLVPQHFALTSLFPKFYALYGTAPLDGFLASSESSYLGAAALALLGAATAFRSRATFWFWMVIGLLSISLAFGGNNPIYPLLYRFLPGTSSFRGPANWLLISSFCGATLAALGFQALLDNAAARVRAFAVSVILLLVCAAILLSSLGAQIYATPDKPFAPWAQVGLFAVVSLLLALLWKTPPFLRSMLNARRVGAALLLVLVFDLFAVSRDMEMKQTILASELETPPPAIAALRAANAATPPQRFWSANAATPLEPWQMQQTLSPTETDAFRSKQGLAARSLMPSCVAAQYGQPGLTGAWGALMPLSRHPNPIYENKTPLDLKLKWLRLLGVGNHLSFGRPMQANWPIISATPPAIYRDDQALPRAFWVGRVVPVTRDEALETVNAPSFDPRREVALETSNFKLNSLSNSNAPALQAATFKRYDETHLEMTIIAPAAGQLVLMDTFYPGWRARVDGRETPIAPANFVGRAIEVEVGTHKVEMWFEPQSVRLGVFISLVALGLLSGVAAAGDRAKRKRI